MSDPSAEQNDTARAGLRNYVLVTAAYWSDTVTDGATRMLVLFYFYNLGYTPLAVASLFIFYEVFGILTNLFGGYIGARFGLKTTLFIGLGTQLVALSMLAFAPQSWLVVAWVMASQALERDRQGHDQDEFEERGQADRPRECLGDTVPLGGDPDRVEECAEGRRLLPRRSAADPARFPDSAQAARRTGRRHLILAAMLMRGGLGQANKKAKFGQMFSRNAAVNKLAAARIFLFGARDVWFVVGLPVFLSSVLGWTFWQSGGFLAVWVIGYGIVQAATPGLLRSRVEEQHEPDGRTATILAFVLAALPAGIALALSAGVAPASSSSPD
jgi:MFS family permease